MNIHKVNLFVVGAQKCGTSSLYYYLSQHPDIFMCPVKEPHFFSDVNSPFKSDYISSVKKNEYASKIVKTYEEYCSLFENHKNEKVIGEASPSYLRDELSCNKIYEYNPNSKILVVIRHPVDRLISHYLMNLASGIEELPILSAIERDQFNIINKCKDNNVIKHYYVDGGMYYEQISRYYKKFSPKNVKIITSEELQKRETMIEVFNFLEVSQNVNIDLSFKNETLKPKFTFVSRLNHFLKKTYLVSSVYNNIFTENVKNKIKKTFLYEKRAIFDISINEKNHLEALYASQIQKLEIFGFSLKSKYV